MDWKEYRTKDGKPYWHNPATNETSWKKPEPLRTPLERELDKTDWRQHADPAGKPYYYNRRTKTTQWDMPPEYAQAVERARAAEQPAAAPAQTAQRWRSQPEAARPSEVAPRTREEAETMFVTLLEASDMDASWTWDRTYRELGELPAWRALRSLDERRAVWERFMQAKRDEWRAVAARRVAEAESAFMQLLSARFPDSAASTTYLRLCETLAEEPAFISVPLEHRESFFEKWRDTAIREQALKRDEARVRQRRHLEQLLRDAPSGKIAADTRFRDARALWASDPVLAGMPVRDQIDCFDRHAEHLAETLVRSRDTARAGRRRAEALGRAGFRALLGELRASGRLTSSSQWKQLYPVFSADPRYAATLGQPGSLPLELFWDELCLLQKAQGGSVLSTAASPPGSDLEEGEL